MVGKDPDLNLFSKRLLRETGLAWLPGPERIVRESGTAALVEEFAGRLRNTVDSGLTGDAMQNLEDPSAGSSIKNVMNEFARRLWSDSCQAMQAFVNGDRGEESALADLPLYWTRLRMLEVLRIFATDDGGLSPEELDTSLRLFESISRNLTGAAPDSADVADCVLWITGFDPYGLDSSRSETLWNTNPSGAAVLALHGRRLIGASGRACRVSGAIFPVRHQDFSEGIVEGLLESRIPRACSYLFTISMGGSPDAFHIDRYPGNCRGASPDNAGWIGGPAPILLGDEPSFVEHSLEFDHLKRLQAASLHFPIRDYRTVEIFEGDRREREPLNLSELAGATAVRGAGGDYLSNEITYRMIRGLAATDLSNVRTAHIHTPRLVAGGGPAALESRRKIVEQIEAMLIAIA